MLSQEDNELLARVGPGTMMGDMFRQYWLPLLMSSELATPDGPPLRVRALGEDLVAFRDSNGEVGLLDAHCPHRGASLFFGRNEDCGLRCVYHGWKFDVSGRCVDMPNEPPESNFKHKVQQRAYACRERNGLIWAYMGPLAEPPDLPALEWNVVPEDQRYMSKRYESCNWAQALEGGIDSSHSGFLHARLDNDYDYAHGPGMRVKDRDKHPRFEVVDTEYGELVAARRTADEANYYWRITQFLMPAYTMLPPYGTAPMSSHFWLPIDDCTTMAWTITWHPTRPLTDDELKMMREGWGLHVGLDMLQPAGDPSRPGSEWQPKACLENDYLIDREAEKTQVFSGLPWIAIQDQALQESMGPVYDRTREHLGTSDSGIIQVRRRWIQAAKDLRQRGVTPPGAACPEAYAVRASAIILPKDAMWVEAAAENLTARAGTLIPSA